MNPFKPHWDLYPKTYTAPKAPTSFLDQLNGDLTKPAWASVPWSDDFDDIRGVEDAPQAERPSPSCRTRFKAMWDDTHLYFGALVESDFETQAHFTERNSPIYQKDSDFEIFVDPIGSCHHYKEFEVNAINTVWNLMLDKPYGDGGREFSGRVAKPGEEQYYEVYNQRSATKVVKGRLNSPGQGATWSVEVAMSFDDLLKDEFLEDHVGDTSIGSTTTPAADDGAHSRISPPPPRAGTMLRVNFSRVEHQGDTNWTWQPQIVWDPTRSRYGGFIQMHFPDAWGYLVLGDSSDEGERALQSNGTGRLDLTIANNGDSNGNAGATVRDPSWPARLAAMNVYYAQHAHRDAEGVFASTMQQLAPFVDRNVTEPFSIRLSTQSPSSSEPSSDHFSAVISSEHLNCEVSITDDRHVQVQNEATDVSDAR